MSAQVWKLPRGGQVHRPWRIEELRPKRPPRDWAADMVRKFGGTRARVAIREAPPDSPLHEYTGMSFGDAVAAARAEAIALQRERDQARRR